MAWKTIISFTDKNTPLRYRVTTSKMPAASGPDWFSVLAEQLNENDFIIDDFEFAYNIGDNSIEPKANAVDKPTLLISEQMVAAVDNGSEIWEG